MAQLLLAILKTARPKQWLKNLAIVASPLFSGHLLEPITLLALIKSIIAFCFLSSSNYIFNDIKDIAADRSHPFKKHRPVANGQLPIPIAWISSIILVCTGLFISYSISKAFLIVALIFCLLQYSYTLLWKHVSIVDILVITAAYFLRVYAGELSTGYHISIWLSFAAFSLAFFLAVGKRRSELTLVQLHGIHNFETRSSLSKYSETLLDIFISLSANAAYITYAYFSFLERPAGKGLLFRNFRHYLLYFTDRKWMMITIPLILFGIMRYMQLIYEGKGESPEKILLSDKILLGTVFGWFLLTIIVIYGIGGY